MRLSEFITLRTEDILEEAVQFAQALPALAHASRAEVRDHFKECLREIVLQMGDNAGRTNASDALASAPGAPMLAAQNHGAARARSGLTVVELAAEYRALRSCVLRLWRVACGPEAEDVEDLTRFNETIDKSLMESIERFEEQVEYWRRIFLGVIGHDLRAPLNAISLTAQLLRLRTTDEAARHSAIIARASNRIGSMLDSLLEYAGSRPGDPMPLHRKTSNIADAMNDEVLILRSAFPATRIELTLVSPGEAEVDISRLREAVANLVSNAAQHGSGSVVEVGVRADEADIFFDVANDGQLLEEELSNIFQPFKAGRRDLHGHRANLGLGLFICRQIVDAHEGEIGITSTGGRVLVSMRIPRR